MSSAFGEHYNTVCGGERLRDDDRGGGGCSTRGTGVDVRKSKPKIERRRKNVRKLKTTEIVK